MKLLCTLSLLAALAIPASASDAPSSRRVRIREITTIDGVRENSVMGYGLVVGLRGTGDQKQTVFTTQMLANVMLRMGMQIGSNGITVKNIAAVFVTSSLPAFARPGTQMDVIVSSIGDAKSLEGGTLLMTPLHGADGQIYATAQGPLSIGGYSAGGGGTSKQLNHPTVGRIANGATAERDVAPDLRNLPSLALLLREADFANAQIIAQRINDEFGRPIAAVADSRRIDISSAGQDVPTMLARIQSLPVEVVSPTRVAINEKTGTIVMGHDARLSAVSILQGSLSIEIATTFQVSQPNPFSKNGETTVVPQTTVNSKDSPAKRIELNEGATVEQLVNGLQAIGASARDVVSILQALKAAGALQADLEVM
ncbi:MAG TPA: flagellar basal body P-ring protein FlgI [Candidatus Saccharimonadales bacterium]|nr:flagellar basal body P-ring protein FlgI [Candidatus Saccharimonadales bacterium]